MFLTLIVDTFSRTVDKVMNYRLGEVDCKLSELLGLKKCECWHKVQLEAHY